MSDVDVEQVDARTVRFGPAVVALAAAVAALLALVAARFSYPAVGPDAVSYLAVARSIHDGNGIAFWIEDPLVTWPPLWPAMIALGMRLTPFRADVAALLLNAAALAGCVVAGDAVARRVLRTDSMRVVMLVSLAVSPLLVGLTILVQTEVLFALLALGVLLALMRWTDDEQPRWLVLAGVLTVTGFFVRYQALYVVPAFAGWVGLRSLLQRKGPFRALADVAWYSLPAVLPAVGWMLRNLSVSDTILGPRFPSDIGPAANLVHAFATTFKFLTSLPSVPALPAGALTAVVIVAAIVVLERRTRSEGDTADGGTDLGLRHRVESAFCGPVGLLTTFVVGFTLLMVVTRSMVGFDDLDIRLLAPCLIPTSLLLLRYCEVVLLPAPSLRGLGRVVVGGWLGMQVVVVVAMIGPSNHVVREYGFNADRAIAASQSPALEALPDDCVVYSNNSADLYRSGFETFISPRKVEYKSSQPTDDLAELVTAVEGGQRACLAWVEYTEDDEYHSRDELAEELELVQLASEDEVTTYVLEPRR